MEFKLVDQKVSLSYFKPIGHSCHAHTVGLLLVSSLDLHLPEAESTQIILKDLYLKSEKAEQLHMKYRTTLYSCPHLRHRIEAITPVVIQRAVSHCQRCWDFHKPNSDFFTKIVKSPRKQLKKELDSIRRLVNIKEFFGLGARQLTSYLQSNMC